MGLSAGFGRAPGSTTYVHVAEVVEFLWDEGRVEDSQGVGCCDCVEWEVVLQVGQRRSDVPEDEGGYIPKVAS